MPTSDRDERLYDVAVSMNGMGRIQLTAREIDPRTLTTVESSGDPVRIARVAGRGESRMIREPIPYKALVALARDTALARRDSVRVVIYRLGHPIAERYIVRPDRIAAGSTTGTGDGPAMGGG